MCLFVSNKSSHLLNVRGLKSSDHEFCKCISVRTLEINNVVGNIHKKKFLFRSCGIVYYQVSATIKQKLAKKEILEPNQRVAILYID